MASSPPSAATSSRSAPPTSSPFSATSTSLSSVTSSPSPASTSSAAAMSSTAATPPTASLVPAASAPASLLSPSEASASSMPFQASTDQRQRHRYCRPRLPGAVARWLLSLAASPSVFCFGLTTQLLRDPGISELDFAGQRRRRLVCDTITAATVGQLRRQLCCGITVVACYKHCLPKLLLVLQMPSPK